MSAPTDYAKRIAVVDGLRRAFEKCKHHRQFTLRVKPIIQAELPGYTVSVDPDHYGLRTIRVWGNGLPYENGSVYLCWNGSKPWAEGMAEQLEISDMRDYVEREAQETTLESTLAEMNAEVVRLREKAAALIAGLPQPQAATIRKDHPCWDGPTGALRERFPELFERIGR